MSTDRELLTSIQAQIAAQLATDPKTPPVTPPGSGFPGQPPPPIVTPPPPPASTGSVASTWDLMNNSRVVLESIAGDASYSKIAAYRIFIPQGHKGEIGVGIGETTGMNAVYAYIWLARSAGGDPINPGGRLWTTAKLGTIKMIVPNELPAGMEYWFNVAPDAAGRLSVRAMNIPNP